MLNMTPVKTIRMSPDKRNVKYIVEKAKGVFLWGDHPKGTHLQSEPQDTFKWLINYMVNNVHAEKIIIFCQSLKACGDSYDALQHFLP